MADGLVLVQKNVDFLGKKDKVLESPGKPFTFWLPFYKQSLQKKDAKKKIYDQPFTKPITYTFLTFFQFAEQNKKQFVSDAKNIFSRELLLHQFIHHLWNQNKKYPLFYGL